METKNLSFTLDKRTFTYDGKNWFDAVTFQVPPVTVRIKLDSLLAQSEDPEQIHDPKVLEVRARHWKVANNLPKAVRYIERARDLSPGNLTVATQFCAILREVGDPTRALAETDSLSDNKHPALMTSRAAAFCDLERWEEAKHLIARVLAMGGSDEAMSVMSRIKSVRPDLYA